MQSGGGLSHGYAQPNGLSLHYASTGEGDLILFLHGFPEFWYARKIQLTDFGKDRQVVALDLPGYNLSEKPTALPAYEGLEDYVTRLTIHRIPGPSHWLAHTRGPSEPDH